nr:hypothetical protein [Tolivirales sp.]
MNRNGNKGNNAKTSPTVVMLQPMNQTSVRGTSSRQGKVKPARKALKQATGLMKPALLPAAYSSASDTLCLQLKSTIGFGNTEAALLKQVIALTPGTIATAGYDGLGDHFPILNSMRTSYSRFMLSKVKVTLQCTSPYTEGGYVAANFEADGTGVSGPPSSLSDVTNARHHVIATPGSPQTYAFAPSDSYNDWRLCSVEADQETDAIDAGIIQIYGENQLGTGTVGVLVTLEFDFYFANYRKVG